ncbi:MAG: hypothetical protein EA381_02945 [Planctomycetaceae bacterium]|nr:MAG: hypothetical protein EA381_02945 [Planctomycetaceae bacterium]
MDLKRPDADRTGESLDRRRRSGNLPPTPAVYRSNANPQFDLPDPRGIITLWRKKDAVKTGLNRRARFFGP